MPENPLDWFRQHCPAHVERMQACTYESRHHMEGNVWAHSSTACELARRYGYGAHIQWACLLHDLGRLLTRTEKDGKVQFGDYEPVSMAMALDILPHAGLDGAQMVRILKIVANQYEAMNHVKFDKPGYDRLLRRYRHEEQLLKDLAQYARCDMNARQVHPSRRHLYDDDAIRAFQEKVAGLPPVPHRPRRLPHTLTLLVGVPCSGKSTFLEQQAEDPRHLVVSRDLYTLEIGALHGYRTYDDSFRARLKSKAMTRQVNALDDAWEAVAEHHPFDVTIDNPNLSASGRRRWIRRKRDSHRIRVVVFIKSLNNLFACEREGKTVSRRSTIRRLKKFQLPLLGDGIDELEFRLLGPNPRVAKDPAPPPELD